MVVCTFVGYHNPDKIGSEAVIDIPGLSEPAEVLSFTSEVTNNNRISVITKLVVESNGIYEAINNISKLDDLINYCKSECNNREFNFEHK